MKVACIFTTLMAATFKLARMILPQLEEGSHGVEVVGMMGTSIFDCFSGACGAACRLRRV